MSSRPILSLKDALERATKPLPTAEAGGEGEKPFRRSSGHRRGTGSKLSGSNGSFRAREGR